MLRRLHVITRLLLRCETVQGKCIRVSSSLMNFIGSTMTLVEREIPSLFIIIPLNKVSHLNLILSLLYRHTNSIKNQENRHIEVWK